MVSIHSKTLAELLRLSPDEKRELASWLRAEAIKAEAQEVPAPEPEADAEEVTVAEVNTIRERLRSIEPYTRGQILTTLRNDLTDDLLAAQEAEPEVAPDFRALILRSLEAVKDADLLEGLYYGTETSRRVQQERQEREEACRNG